MRFSNGTSYGGESAVAIYWENEILLPNEEKEFVTYYGIGKFTQELRPPLAVSLTSVSEIQANENDYCPKSFYCNSLYNEQFKYPGKQCKSKDYIA